MAMNNVSLIGRLTKDVELKKVGDNISTVSFSLAVDRTMSKADREAAQAAGKATADFINCVAWRQTAEILAKYAKKGTLLGIDGRLQTRSYEGQNGPVYVTEVVVSNAQLLSGTNTASNTATTTTPAPATPAAAPVEAVEPEVFADISADDLPF